MSKKYLIATIVINVSFYVVMILSRPLDLSEIFWALDPLGLIHVLFTFDFFGMIVGDRIAQKNPKDKHARMGNIINVTVVISYIVYFVFWTGLSYS